MMGTSLRHVGL